MTGGRTPRLFMLASILTVVVAVVGFIVTVILNAFVLDKYDAYGEVPVPGSSSLHLPAGEATVSFHTQVIGGSNGGGLPIPQLGLTIVPPEGIPEPQVTENFGNTTTVNNDAHVRVWVVQVLTEGTYDITTDGKVNGYINPRLAFGHDASFGWPAWAFAGLFVLGLVELTASIVYAVRSRPPPTALSQQPIDIGDSSRVDSSSDVSEPSTPDVSDPYTPTDDGIRFEALRNLKALRDSGALTEDEFKAEKRRILKD